MTDRRMIERLRAREESLRNSLAEAQRLLPDLLELPADALRARLRRRPELRTAGMMRRLLDVARDAVDRYPGRARDLTAAVVEILPFVGLDEPLGPERPLLCAEAWMEHARTSHAVGAFAEARRAITFARDQFQQSTPSPWLRAIADLIEARILDDLGVRENALSMIRGAADALAFCGDHEHFVEARMTEASILWRSGDRAAAMAIWPSLASAARQWGDVNLVAGIERRMATLLLREGNAEKAAELLMSALSKFGAGSVHPDAIRARWHLAESFVKQGRTDDALAEFHDVRARLIAADRGLEAALASLEILDVLLDADREDDLPAAAETCLEIFRDGLSPNAFEALAYLHAEAAAGTLTRDAVAAVRHYLEDVRIDPNHPFEPPFEPPQ